MCNAESSEAGDGLLFGPVLDFDLSECEVKTHADHVDGSREEKDIPPSRHRILEAENTVIKFPSPPLPEPPFCVT